MNARLDFRSRGFDLKNLKITTKVFGGFGLVLALLVTVGIVGSLSLSSGSSDFTRYRGIALQTNQAGRIQANLLEARMAVKNFIISGSEESVAAVKSRAATTIELNKKLGELVQTEDKQLIVEHTEDGMQKYVTAFGKVTELQAHRNDLVTNTLDAVGPQIERKLTEIMKSANADGDPEAAFLAGTTLRNLMLVRLYAYKYLVNNQRAAYDRVVKEMKAFESEAADLKASLQNPTRRRLATEVVDLTGQYADGFEEVYATIEERNSIVAGTLDVVGPNIAGEMEDLKLSIKAEQDELGPRATANMSNAVTMAIIISLVAVAFGGLAAWVIGFGISKPISAMTTAMKTLADGNLEIEIPGTDRGDEVGDMAEAVQVFKDNAIEVRKMEAQKEAEFKAAEERRKRMEQMSAEFENTVTGVIEAVSSAATEMQSTARSMSDIAEGTSEQSSAVAAASEQATANVQTVASASEELASSVKEISRQVEESSSIAKSAVAEANQATAEVRGLVEASQRIGEVIGLINDIASQTNLLALNATIEAARAGEAGKGFAVVASEVKTLASQTAKATEDISSQIASVQEATSSAVQVIEGISTTIGKINEIATAISAAVEEQGAATGEISRNVQEAARGTQDVNTNIVKVSQGASETGVASTQVLSATEELSQQAGLLGDQVKTFLENIQAA